MRERGLEGMSGSNTTVSQCNELLLIHCRTAAVRVRGRCHRAGGRWGAMRCVLLLVAAAAELRSGLVAPSCPRRHLKRTLRCDVEAPERSVWRRLAAKVGRAARRGYDPRLLREAAWCAMGRRSR